MEKLLHERLREHDDEEEMLKIQGGEGILELYKSEAQALADEIERYYIPRPRFDDGEPVQFGEEFDADGEEIERILWFGATRNGLRIYCDSSNLFDLLPNECLKRPTPKVLDADSVRTELSVKARDGFAEIERYITALMERGN